MTPLPLGFLPYHNVNHNEAEQITRLGADMRVSMQSERLSGTGSLLTATNKDMDPTLQANKHKTYKLQKTHTTRNEEERRRRRKKKKKEEERSQLHELIFPNACSL